MDLCCKIEHARFVGCLRTIGPNTGMVTSRLAMRILEGCVGHSRTSSIRPLSDALATKPKPVVEGLIEILTPAEGSLPASHSSSVPQPRVGCLATAEPPEDLRAPPDCKRGRA